MKINWILRLKNKPVLIALIAAVVSFVYTVCNLFGLTLPIEQSEVIKILETIVGILVIMGIVVDPTTEGVSDSEQAMDYIAPKKEMDHAV